MSYAPPQGFTGQPPTTETIIAEVQSVVYSANASIYGSPITPAIPVETTIEWTVYFAFDGNQAVMEMSLDGGTSFSIIKEDITTTVGYLVKVVVSDTDSVVFRFTKAGTIIYCRIGQPV